MVKPFDVVVVPDFLGPLALRFEVQTAFFLASWMENAGRARTFPLHVACIGEPPPRVERMAELSGASLTVHAPKGIEARGVANKLRAFEVSGKTERVLILDTDVLILSDFSPLSDLGRCIAAAPDNRPMVPEGYWMRIYEALGMELPPQRIASVRGELGFTRLRRKDYQDEESDLSSMWPYYNTGVVFLPWDSGFGRIWEEHIRKIKGLFSEEDEAWRSVGRSNQAGFATAVQSLRASGVAFRRLEHPYNSNYLHLYRGSLADEEMKLFHAFGFGKTAMPGPEVFRRAVNRYLRDLLGMMYRLWEIHLREAPPVREAARCLMPSAVRVLRLVGRIRWLHSRHIARVL